MSQPTFRSVILIDGVQHKKCPDCEETKPVDEGFGWRTESGKRYPMSFCKACRRARRRNGGWVRKTEPRPVMPEGRAWCTTCKQDLPAEAFGVSSKTPNGLTYSCRECNNRHVRESKAAMTPEQRQAFLERKKASNDKHPLTRKRRNLRHFFNMTLEQYEAMYAEQGGVCAICKKPETAKRGDRVLDLAVDHDHACCPEKGRSCGKCVRRLLCGNCNNGLGKFFDDPALLEAAAAYLREHEKATQAA